jgi:hypothetical protein
MSLRIFWNIIRLLNIGNINLDVIMMALEGVIHYLVIKAENKNKDTLLN